MPPGPSLVPYCDLAVGSPAFLRQPLPGWPDKALPQQLLDPAAWLRQGQREGRTPPCLGSVREGLLTCPQVVPTCPQPGDGTPSRGTAECDQSGSPRQSAGGVHPSAAVAIPLLLSLWCFPPSPWQAPVLGLAQPGGFSALLPVPPALAGTPWHLLWGGRAVSTAGCSPPHPQEPCNGCCLSEGAPISPSGPG